MNNSCLNISVSCVQNYFSKTPKDVNLLTWLRSTKYAHVVQQIRTTADAATRKRLKASLPAITPSGMFSRVDEQGLLQHSGFIQFDIDGKDNEQLRSYPHLHQQLSHINNIAYCGRSVSGNGWWGLVRIADASQHLGYWLYLQKAFQHMGICIDQAPKNICSLRGYSYDADAYFNHHATALHEYQPTFTGVRISSGSVSHAHVEQKIAALERQELDITAGYRAWFNIGCCFAATYGADGCDYFHRVSCFHPQYTVAATDYQYTQCLRFVQAKGSQPSLGYFYKLCKEGS